MQITPKLSLPLIQPSQAQKHITHNEALLGLDAITQLAVLSRSLKAPPSSPSQGDIYLVAVDATDHWQGRDNQIAAFQNGVFIFYQPQNGWRCYIEDERLLLVFHGGLWEVLIQKRDEISFARSESVTVSLSGRSIKTGLIFPNRSIILGVTSETVKTVSGNSAYNVGTAGQMSQFGGFLGVALGSRNIGVIGPTAVYQDVDVLVSIANPDLFENDFGETLEILSSGRGRSLNRPPAEAAISPAGSVAAERDLSGGCQSGLTYAEAISFVENIGARLPTLQEIQRGAGWGLGCGFDGSRVWTQTPGNSSNMRCVPFGNPEASGSDISEIDINGGTADLTYVWDIEERGGGFTSGEIALTAHYLQV